MLIQFEKYYFSNNNNKKNVILILFKSLIQFGKSFLNNPIQ